MSLSCFHILLHLQPVADQNHLPISRILLLFHANCGKSGTLAFNSPTFWVPRKANAELPQSARFPSSAHPHFSRPQVQKTWLFRHLEISNFPGMEHQESSNNDIEAKPPDLPEAAKLLPCPKWLDFRWPMGYWGYGHQISISASMRELTLQRTITNPKGGSWQS